MATKRSQSAARKPRADGQRNRDRVLEAAKAALGPKFTYVHGVRDLETPQNARVNVRGNPNRLDGSVQIHTDIDKYAEIIKNKVKHLNA